MILQSLYEYYRRADELPREGWVRRGVDYVVVLDGRGVCVGIELIAEPMNGRLVSKEAVLPAIGKQALKHTNSGQDANLLWDNASFVLGRGNKGTGKLNSFVQTIKDWLGDSRIPEIDAVLKFCASLQAHPDKTPSLLAEFHVADEFATRDPILMFRMVDAIEPVHDLRAVRDAFEGKYFSRRDSAGVRGNCLVTGDADVPIAKNESVIKGVWKAQSSGANIISFNKRSFESYGKTGRNGENAPVSERASFAYVTALNHLLASKQRVQVGDSSTVFWADRAHDFESEIGRAHV